MKKILIGKYFHQLKKRKDLAHEEIMFYVNELKKHYEVEIIENILEFDFRNKDKNEYEAILIWNNVDLFFGGVERLGLKEWIDFVNHFECKIFWMRTDVRFWLDQLIGNKIWKSRKKLNTLNNEPESNFYIKQNKLETISQFEDDVKLKKWQYRHKKYHYYELSNWPLYHWETIIDNERNGKLVYWGSNRSDKRTEMFNHYFKDKEIDWYYDSKYCKDEMKEQFPKVTFKQRVKHGELQKELSNYSYTVLIGDTTKNGIIKNTPCRIFEAVKSGLVVFIDKSFDKEKRFFDNPLLIEFNYVLNNDELNEKIKILQKNEKLRKIIIQLQLESIMKKFGTKDEHIKKLIKIIEE